MSRVFGVQADRISLTSGQPTAQLVTITSQHSRPGHNYRPIVSVFLLFLLGPTPRWGTTKTGECIWKWRSNTFPFCRLLVLAAAATLACRLCLATRTHLNPAYRQWSYEY